MNRCTIPLFLLCCLPALLSSQPVAGRIIDQTSRRPLAFVNVTLQRSTDSSLVSGAATDKKGSFEFSAVPPGRYFLNASIVGYARKRIDGITVPQSAARVNLGAIPMTETAVSMNDVLVTGQKALMNTSIDRKVYNVDQDIVSKAGSAADLLRNVPSVEVDIDGTVTLRGTSDVLILVNGRNSALMGKSRAEVLQQMPASSIEKIEVITNPSAKYKPDGASGIINIVMKKNTSLGLNGSATANTGAADRYNANLRVNYNPGAVNLFASYGFRQDNRSRASRQVREQTDAYGQPLLFEQSGSSNARPLAHMASAGCEIAFDDAYSAGLAGSLFLNDFTRSDRTLVRMQSATPGSSSEYNHNLDDREYEHEYEWSAFVQRNFDDEDHTLRAELKSSWTPEEENNHYTTLYRLPSVQTLYENTRVHEVEHKNECTIDYSNKVSEHTQVEAGYAGEFNAFQADLSAEEYAPAQARFVTNTALSNDFHLDEMMHALYATFEHSFGSFGIMGGLRAEQVFLRSYLVTLDSTVSNDYAAFYPTLHTAYKLTDESELQLNYSKRTRRPDMDDLNPFPEYRDLRNISSGNPKLLPECTHSIEFGVKYQTDDITLLPSVYYRYTYNRFTSVVVPLNDSTLLTTEQNLSHDQSAGLETVFSFSSGSWINAHLSANVFYNVIDASNLGYSSNKSVVTWSGACTANLTPFPGTTVQMNGSYNSARLTPQGNFSPSYVINLGLRHEIIEKRLSMVFTIADIFRTLKRNIDVNTPLLKQTVNNTRDARIFYFGLTYHFGTEVKKQKEESIRYDNGL